MIDFATLQGLTIPEGVVTQIEDASGRVIWKKKKIVGTFIMRPSADISVGHNLYPTDSTAAYLLINEETSDGDATYIYDTGSTFGTRSKFRLSGASHFQGSKITSVNVIGVPLSHSDDSQRFTLEVDGVEVVTVSIGSSSKDFDESLPEAVGPINNYLAMNKSLPVINLSITTTNDSTNNKAKNSGITQIYVALGYEGY